MSIWHCDNVLCISLTQKKEYTSLLRKSRNFVCYVQSGKQQCLSQRVNKHMALLGTFLVYGCENST